MKRREFILGSSGMALASFGAASGAVASVQERAAVDVDPLAAHLRGRMVLPGDPAFDRLRRVMSAKVDRRPAAIVRCAAADDVRHSVEFARRQKLSLAVRGGGHSLPGHSTCDGGLVLDLSGLKGISVDPQERVARVGGGVVAGELDRATAPHGLATVLGECPSVGIGGFALAGGEGHLMGRFGLGCDNVLAAEVALADGRLVRASQNEHPDLYWALRGGGGNFGVVTAFELRLHPVSQVLAGRLRYRADRPAAFLRFWRDYAATAPDELTMTLRFVPGPDGRPVIVIRATWSGDPGAGRKALEPLRSHGELVSDTTKTTAYLMVQSEAPSDPIPVYDETRSGFIPQLSDAAIEVLAERAARPPASFMVGLAHLHGAVSRVAEDATAYPLREPGFDCWITAEWESPSGRDEAVHWVESSWTALRPHTRGAYVNGLEDEGEERVRSAYGRNYARLAEIKKRYDPDNAFRINQNIRPAP